MFCHICSSSEEHCIFIRSCYKENITNGILSRPYLTTSLKFMRENCDLISDECHPEAVLQLQSLCSQSSCVDPVLTRHQMYQKLSLHWSFMGKYAMQCKLFGGTCPVFLHVQLLIGNRLKAILAMYVCLNGEQNESRPLVAEQSFAMEIL